MLPYLQRGIEVKQVHENEVDRIQHEAEQLVTKCVPLKSSFDRFENLDATEESLDDCE